MTIRAAIRRGRRGDAGDRAQVGAGDRAHAAGRPHPGRRRGATAGRREAGDVDAGDRRGRGGRSSAAQGAKPAFKGYRGFPATVCISINEEVVHGIPSAHRRVKEGDIVGLDLGCIVEGYYADCAFTLPIGEVPPRVQELLDVTRESLEAGIEECRPGRRLSDVSHAIQVHVESHGFSVVRAFVGHGIGRALHEEPQVPNFGDPGRGPQLKAGHGAGHRAHGDDGELGGPDPGRRLDGGDEGRQPGRPLRAHDRGDGGGARGADAQERRRAPRRA